MAKEKGMNKPDALWNQDPRQAVPLIQYAIGACSGMVTPILHCGFGPRGQMTQVFSAPLILFIAIEERAPLLLMYLPVWLAFVAYRSVTRDEYQHSWFQGWQWLALMIPFINSHYRAMAIEPWLVLGFACWVFQHHVGTSMLFFISAIALFCEFVLYNGNINKRRRIVRDSQIEAMQWQDTNQWGGR